MLHNVQTSPLQQPAVEAKGPGDEREERGRDFVSSWLGGGGGGWGGGSERLCRQRTLKTKVEARHQN